MPRPKVKDQDRQRAPTACVPCKQSKIRCDAKIPCATCVRKGRTASCRYLDNSSVRRASTNASTSLGSQKNDTLDAATARLAASTTNVQRQFDDTLHNNGATIALGHKSHQDSFQDSSTALDDDDATSGIAPDRSCSENSPEETQSRLLLNSKGERVYIGEMASLSFLEFLRRTLRYHMGRTPFTEANARDVMLEAEISDSDSGNGPNLSVGEKQTLLQCYSEATSGILELHTQSELALVSNRSRDKQQDADILLAIAIGAQTRGEIADVQLASQYYRTAQSMAFEDMLFNPSMRTIKNFVLMAFYMLGACRRNAGFMYLGVAAKAACALGLHSSEYYLTLPAGTRESARRVWKSLFVLDTIVSSVLGRPSSLPAQEMEVPSRTTETSLQDSATALDACYGSSTYLNHLIQTIPGKKTTSLEVTEEFLGQLKQWSQNLSPNFRRLASSPLDRELLLGNAHLGCIYYFSIMLATRPFLIAHLISKLARRQAPRPSIDEESTTRMAQVCLDAAISVARSLHNIMMQGAFLGNMCLFKAFIFAAGLLIGFSLFAAETSDPDAQTAMWNARAVLQQLSQYSPQARHYHDILNDFSQAIDKYHRQKLRKRRRDTNQYIDHIFDLDRTMSIPNPVADTGQQHYLSPVSGDSNGADMTTINDPTLAGAEPMSFDDNFDFDAMMNYYDPENLPFVWDDFDLS